MTLDELAEQVSSQVKRREWEQDPDRQIVITTGWYLDPEGNLTDVNPSEDYGNFLLF